MLSEFDTNNIHCIIILHRLEAIVGRFLLYTLICQRLSCFRVWHLYVFSFMCFCLGKYKVEIFDRESNKFIPSISGLGMHVEVRDPDDKTLMSRVRFN